MSTFFRIQEHVVEGQHIREYAQATAHSQEEVLKLHVKQYIPIDNPDPKPGDITIIASHANGFVKELYEPLWEDLLQSCRQNGVDIRGIWIADVAWQGQSGVLNEANLGNDPSWFDHARDLLHLTNHFRAQMPRPLVGIGHSFGGTIIVNLAYMHPRLFAALVIIDPIITVPAAGPADADDDPVPGFQRTLGASSARRDLWPSRAAAARAVRRNKFYATWDPRAVARLLQFGLRDCPTLLYPDAAAAKGQGKEKEEKEEKEGEDDDEDEDDGGPPVTLTTTKHMECFTYYRRVRLGARDPATGQRAFARALTPDADAGPGPGAASPAASSFGWYQAAPAQTGARLGELRPGVLWVTGAASGVGTAAANAARTARTGSGWGGSGGAAAGRVRASAVPAAGHLVALERPGAVAARAGPFLGAEAARWRREEAAWRRAWAARVPDAEKAVMSAEFLEAVRAVAPPAGRGRDRAKL